MEHSSNKLLAKNSIFLYGRMLVSVWLNLAITRLVLKELGSEAFGTYGVVGSVVAIFSILDSGIVLATQRFISFELGKKDGDMNLMFNTLLNAIRIFSVFAFVVIELVGFWYIKEKLNIPVEIRQEAIWVFHFSIITSLITLLTAPYNALVIAHEKMNVFAYISIFQVLLTFFFVWCLRFFSENKLFLYGLIAMIVSIIVRLVYQIYCHYQIKDFQQKWVIDRNKLKGISSFAGFSILDGGLCTISWQGLVLVMNSFFGVGLNAAYTISNTLRNMILSFAQNVQKAVSPQITKTFAEGDFNRHNLLVYNGSKAQIYLILLLVIPAIIKTPYILQLWLGGVPEFTVLFCQLSLLMAVLNASFETVRTSAYATGNIRRMVVISNLYQLASVPICYLINKIYHSPVLMMVFIVVLDYVAYGVRFYLASKVSIFSLKAFGRKVILSCTWIGLVTAGIVYVIGQYIPDNIVGLLFVCFINFIVLTTLFVIAGVSKSERKYLLSHSVIILKKFIRK